MKIEINQLSGKYTVRKMSEQDIPLIYSICLNNQQYYQYCEKQPSRELIKKDYKVVRLGIDKGNPQSTHFWKKNQFEVIKEVKQDEGMILVAERKICDI